MSKVLYIKANAKSDGLSRTFKISDIFIETYKEAHPEDEIITLDLYNEGIDFLPKGNLDAVKKPEEGIDKDHPILKYAYQFLEADKYVIAEPLWNLSVPAILKAYIDYISVTGITFKYTESGPVGLCTGKKAINITSRGGNYDAEPYVSFEMGDRYLKTMFAFLGITDFTTISADALDVVGNDVYAIVEKAVMVAKITARNF
ncbi:FMN-dependent NADH-azoreductase [Clostridium peptidivorans]|uniref:FMN-dependent NADH-azoreductase n=1 Tax=Clostridium peptidivorans TaxID=100174 RepID=UPI000BE48ED3|nr:FMN-dependent NADH-azoreductase [Clostridium peptidivorans]